ncbi:hypothetical protein L596_009630 [Steinernema carpocapsae]|uniref:3-hydroxyisobutyryl-coenzyme A hydrolase n=1 Tax=Steinernema carpocapsae TaxID=34508 RepID=A0A4U5PH80_STECR|nr:hypothetical protein L596_009630 [Steinernema carpocapsae]
MSNSSTPRKETLEPRNFETLNVRTDKHVTYVELNRPFCANAFNNVMLVDLHDAIRFYSAYPQTRVLVFSGAGRCFSKGIDFKGKSPAASIQAALNSRAGSWTCPGRRI